MLDSGSKSESGGGRACFCLMIYKSAYKVIYNGTDITAKIQDELIGISYSDRVEGESDELTITLEDTKSLWRNSWYPTKTDKLEFFIGWNDHLTPCGTFEIDEINTAWDGSGFSLQIKALSAIISAPFRTEREQRYTNLSLRKLANTIAARGQMSVTGIIEDITISSVVQAGETDLAFLRRISGMYGYIFSIKSGELVFTNVGKLQSRAFARSIGPSDMSAMDINDNTARTFKAARLSYWDADKGKKVFYEAKSKFESEAKGDILEMEGFVENEQQAELRAKAAISKAENATVTGYARLNAGIDGMLAGNNVQIIGVGKVSGVFHIEKSDHSIDKSGGYDITIDVFRVDLVSSNLF